MDTMAKGPPEDGVQDLNLDASEWSTESSHEMINNNNSTYLYIAVEYVKDEMKMEPTANLAQAQDTFTDFDAHVSPLDPNMGSIARFSPVYSEGSAEFNPIVLQQIVPETQTELLPETALENMPVLCNNDIGDVVSNQFLQMVEDGSTTDQALTTDNNQEVELLITCQETGISYSVRSQEFLVSRCLEDEQLLNSLSPDPLLESQLLALDDNTLKSELNDEMINSAVVNNYISSLTDADLKSVENPFRMETRKKTHEVDFEEQLLSRVYSIIDRPVLSRARATLPESYLIINKIDEGVGVFAKKPITKSTQFGPLTGVVTLLDPEYLKTNPDDLKFLLEDCHEKGVLHQLDVSDENTTNWMSFVRKAHTFEEQNLVLTQEDGEFYFTTTKNVLPKEELKVGYGPSYASRHNFASLAGSPDETWMCFQCVDAFSSSQELQKHLDVHDNDKDENVKPRKKVKRKPPAKRRTDAFRCNDCHELFIQPGKLALRQHLIEKHLGSRLELVDQYFSSVTNYKCRHCEERFNTEALLNIHTFLHEEDNLDEQTNHVCPMCQKKFPTQRQLVTHVSTHALPKPKSPQNELFKCTVCNKSFALGERLRRHMMVHGSEESKPYKCKTCNKRFLNSSALAGHVKIHFVGKKIFECPICKERFDHVLQLKSHVPLHLENSMYSCPHCSKLFSKYSIIRKHIRAFHCDQKHACPHCAKMFPTVDKLKMHMLRHSDHREFLCADCGKQFKRKDKLKEHCKRMHSEERENDAPRPQKVKKVVPKSEPTDFHRFIYKCHTCLVGFKRRGMLVNHLAKRHPDISMDSVPELNLPILQTTRDYYCQHCDKVYKSSSKRKAHILKNHPGAALPMSNRKQPGGTFVGAPGLPDPMFSQTVGSVATRPQNCKWCHKQYASKAKLLQHQRKKHSDQMAQGSGGEEKCDEGLDPLEQKHNTMADIVVEDHCLDDYKLTEADILEELNNGREGEQFCQLVPIVENDGFAQTTDFGAPSSHLFRLLTTSSGLVPPR